MELPLNSTCPWERSENAKTNVKNIAQMVGKQTYFFAAVKLTSFGGVCTDRKEVDRA